MDSANFQPLTCSDSKPNVELLPPNLTLDSLTTILSSIGADSDLMLDFFQLSIDLISAFIRANFTGDFLDIDEYGKISLGDTKTNEEVQKSAIDFLMVDGEAPYSTLKLPAYLLVSRWILVENGQKFSNNGDVSNFVDLWAVRCIFLIQKCIDHKSNTLKEEIFRRIAVFDRFLDNDGSLISKDWKILLCSESSYYFTYYFDYKSAQRVLDLAGKLAGFKLSLTGVLGKIKRLINLWLYLKHKINYP